MNDTKTLQDSFYLVIKTPLDATIIQKGIRDVAVTHESLSTILADEELVVTFAFAEVVQGVGAVSGFTPDSIDGTAGAAIQVGRAAPLMQVSVIINYLTLFIIIKTVITENKSSHKNDIILKNGRAQVTSTVHI